MKNIIRPIVLGIIGNFLAMNAEAGELKVTTQVEESNKSGKLNLTATFDTNGFSSSNLEDDRHPAFGAYRIINDVLSTFGTVESGVETGPRRSSVKVEVATIDRSALVSKTMNDQPNIVKNLLQIHDLFEPVRKDLETKNSAEIGRSAQGLPFVELKLQTASEIHRILLCVTLPYESQIKKNLKIPLFLASKIESECSIETEPSILEQSTNLQQNKLLFSSQSPFELTSEELWQPTNFDTYYQICRPSTPTQLDELIAAEWIKEDSSAEKQINECQKFIQKNIVSKMRESITTGFSGAVFDSNVNDYYRLLVESLMKANHVNYQLTAKNFEENLIEKLKSALSPKNGVTKNELTAKDFNLQGFMSLLQKGEATPEALLLSLMEAPQGKKSLFREELAKASDSDKEKYTERMLAVAKKPCITETINPSCIYSGASRIGESVTKLKLQSGLETVNEFEGFYLPAAPEKVTP